MGADGDGAGRTPFAHELVGEWRFELGGGVAVLGEDAGEGAGLEVAGEFEDVLEAGVGHGEEEVLHVDDEKSGCHLGGRAGVDWKGAVSWWQRMKNTGCRR